MSLNAVAQNNQVVNPFQRYLIPEESQWVRFVMQKAGEYGRNGNFFTSRAYSVACATAAAVLSAFNSISYLFQAPVRILLNIVTFSPVSIVTNFIKDLTNAMLSFVFVGLGITFIISGLLMPGPVFTNFAPEKELSLESLLKQKEEEILNRDKEIEKLKEHMGTLSTYYQSIERELSNAKAALNKAKEPPKKSGWFF